MRSLSKIACLIAIIAITINTNAADNAMQVVFNKAKQDHYTLSRFVADMPKGGDLHNHLWGASYPENMLGYAFNDKLCVDAKTFALSTKLPCNQAYPLKTVLKDHHLIDRVLRSWTMWHFTPTKIESNHDHFFASFAKTAPLIDRYRGEMIHEVAHRAGREHENYLELMITNDNANAMQLADQLPFDKDYAKDRQRLLAHGLLNIVADVSKQIDAMNAKSRQLGDCKGENADASCAVTVRYQYLAIRVLPEPEVFAQLLTGFELSKRDPRVVAINLVAPEDDPTSLKNYKDHMQMIAYLHKQYPGVKISLHAGELAPKMVSEQALLDHINDAINVAHADRIGHGTDILSEANHQQILQTMAAKGIAVEINLTSNEKLLGIKNEAHPLKAYLKNHVPVVLSTDDEGILRTYLNREYRLAVKRYNLSYAQLKQIDRNSLTYSFLPGKSLWSIAASATPASACIVDNIGGGAPSSACRNFLAKSEKARLQWRLEGQLTQFEQQWRDRA